MDSKVLNINSSFLRWAGSKRQLVPKLSSFWNESYLRYIEPFAGSSVLFFNISPSRAILSDINSELTLTYNEIKNNLEEVLGVLRKINIGKEEYLRLREINPVDLSNHYRAARFIYLNRFCFNGLYRTNRKGEFNVPYGGTSQKCGSLPSDDLFIACSKILQNAEIINCDFEVTLEKAVEGDFVYLDPPYSVKNNRVFIEYSPSTFSIDSVNKIKDWISILDRKGVKFLLSYAESEESEYLKRGFSWEIVEVKRNIAGFYSDRKIANEILIYN